MRWGHENHGEQARNSVVTLHSQVWTSESWRTSYFCYDVNMNQIYVSFNNLND